MQPQLSLKGRQQRYPNDPKRTRVVLAGNWENLVKMGSETVVWLITTMEIVVLLVGKDLASNLATSESYHAGTMVMGSGIVILSSQTVCKGEVGRAECSRPPPRPHLNLPYRCPYQHPHPYVLNVQLIIPSSPSSAEKSIGFAQGPQVKAVIFEHDGHHRSR
ncbi:hypothetical protein Tco_0915281 [Tanacetum coccineum]